MTKEQTTPGPAAGQSATAGPLEGLRVLDTATGAAAFAGRILADLGADVVKLEPPGGEVGRRTPPFVTSPDGPSSLFFWHYNLGKQSCVLDPSDRHLSSLLDWADVVIDGGPEQPFDLTGARIGRPGVVHAHIAGFGAGPRASWVATELVAQAAGGMMYVNGNPDDTPLRAYGEQAHHLASHYLVTGILLALRVKRRTGLGQAIEVTLQEAVASAVEHVGVLYNYEDKVPSRQGDLHWVRAYAIFECSDGYVTLCWNRNWRDLVALLAADGAEGDLDDPKFEIPEVLDSSIEHIREVLQAWARPRTAVEIFERGQLFRMPWAMVNPPGIALLDPHLRERGFFAPLVGPSGSILPASGVPVHLSATPWRARAGAPSLGANSDSILQKLAELSPRKFS